MGIKADWKYNGTVRAGSGLVESGTGTPSYQVMLTCEDGDTSFQIWLTEKNKERATKAFETLGVPADKLKDAQFFEYEMGGIIEGVEVSFGTREEEYRGKRTVKVAWIGKPSAALAGSLSSAAAAFFGGKAEAADEKRPTAVGAAGATIEDDDIPF